LAWFIAFGPILILPIYDWRYSVRYLLDNQYLLIYGATIAAFGWIGGKATYRYVYWAMPVVFLLVGLAIERCASLLRRNGLLLTILLSSYLLSQRVFWLWPEDLGIGGASTSWVLLTPLAVTTPVPDLVGMGSLYVRAVSLVSYLALSALLLFLLSRSGGRFRKGADRSPRAAEGQLARETITT